VKENKQREIDDVVAVFCLCWSDWPRSSKIEDKNEKEDEGVEEGDWERKKMIGKGVAARSLVRKLVEMKENEEKEIDAVVADSACVGRIGRGRPKMEDKNEKEGEGVGEGD